MNSDRLGIRRRLVAVFALAAALAAWSLASGPDRAGADQLPPCSPAAQSLAFGSAFPPFGRAERNLQLPITAANESEATNVVVVVASTAGSQVFPVAFTGGNTKATVVPAVPDPQTHLYLEWDQDLESTIACHGVASHEMPIIPAGATGGHPRFPRFAGRYRVRAPLWTHGHKRIVRPIWTVQPICDYFACTVHIRSSLKLRDSFRLTGSGTYERERTYPPADDCVTKKGERLVAKNVYHVRLVQTIRPKRVKDGLVTAFTVLERWNWEPNARGQRLNCRAGQAFYDHFAGRLIQAG